MSNLGSHDVEVDSQEADGVSKGTLSGMDGNNVNVTEEEILGDLRSPSKMYKGDTEVSKTVTLGEKLGARLSNFNEMVKESIVQEGGFEVDWVNSNGRSGGIASLWDPKVFRKDSTILNDNFVSTSGFLVNGNQRLNVVNVYAPQNNTDKRVVWQEILRLIQCWQGWWVVLCDFNAVRCHEERKNSTFDQVCARDFNEFIDEADLKEYNMKGKKYTFMASRGDIAKLSKIDRVLVCSNFISKWPNACLRAFHRERSDHAPLVLSIVDTNFGPKPFRLFNSWVYMADCEDVVGKILRNCDVSGPPDVILMKKFRLLRDELKKWVKDCKIKEGENLKIFKSEKEDFELLTEEKGLEEDEVWVWEQCKKGIEDIKALGAKDLKQKSRVKWASFGDDNTTFFHRWLTGGKFKTLFQVWRLTGNGFLNPLWLRNMFTRVLIYKSQSAFLKDRFILDGPLIVSELVDWLKKNNKKAFLLKIDFEKAYDNVNWNFLINIMLQMGFPNHWCLWVKEILDSARSAVLVNGSPTFEFKCEKGLRQGDPLSPFLFLIVMETLSWMLSKAREIGDVL
ncbi:uncharacterized protein LOC143571228 [Bidens hawaiensis]|uniref:uncharacterized protein LOC143571228 n=1 Tax=Bidens hawaiensis TaxID=980011 RepID=UPI00404B2A1D